MQKTAKVRDVRIVQKKSYENSFLLTLSIQDKLNARPGQYVFIYCENLTIRRAFSIADLTDDCLTIFFKKRGLGTEFLSKLRPGDVVNLIGPLGQGFSLNREKSLLIGAGAGVAPVFFAKNFLKKQGVESLLVGGFNTKNEIPDELKLDKYTTIDGSCGFKGNVLEYFTEIIKEYQPSVIYACGPTVVLKTVAEWGLKYKIRTELAMEKEMACGVGVCRGCVIKIKKNEEIINATVCKDGPVFRGEEVVW
ncbi:MAG: hypothetical protein LBG48_05195 [Rickettsiales bacterium]|jgi:dihydroorotate dehydrogenase electron transfer subunit|nr:hypothetical protein [Rickettsiales bacterium]